MRKFLIIMSAIASILASCSGPEDGEYTFPVFYDTEHDAAGTYDASVMPTTFFIDKEGYVVNQHVGAISAEKIEEGIESIIGE